MNKYQKRNKARFAGALVCIFISNAFAVILQFFKGDILDNAISGETGATLQSIILLITFILGEILFYFGYRQFSARFVVGCTGMLKHDCLHRIKRGGRPPEKGNEAAEGGKANRYKWEWVDESV